MSTTYIISVDSIVAIEADSEDEAMVLARAEFIEILQRDEAELITVEEYEDE